MNNKNDFKSLVGGVQKIKTTDTSPDFYSLKKANSTTKKQHAESFEHSAISQADYDIGAEDKISFQRDGVQNQLIKKMAQGELNIFESIDLHGMTTLEAEIYLANTIDSQRLHHMSCLRVVHGKGYHTGESTDNKPAPKLKNFTARYLAEHPRVLAYVSCPPNRGGTGAVYVLLSRFDNDR